MKIEKAIQARELLREKETLEKAINYTSSEFEVTVKVDAEHPWKTRLTPFLQMFVKEELQEMMKKRLLEVEKQLRRL